MKIKYNKIVILLIFNFLLTFNLFAEEFSKIDPKLKSILKYPELSNLNNTNQRVFQKNVNNSYITVIIKSFSYIHNFENTDIRIQANIGDITTAYVPINQIEKLINNDNIQYIQSPKQYHTLTDKSIPEINTPMVYQNYNSYGRNVIIGIIDTGIDWKHRDFRKSNGKTRIKYLLDFSYPGDIINNDNILDGPDQFGGTLYTEQDINSALQGSKTIHENDIVGHGTHVAGCAAGNGTATGNNQPSKKYVGVAPEADLVIVKATRVQGADTFESNDYINALAFIDSIATVLNRPCVINMSLGGNEGPHDGTSLEEQAVDQIAGPGIPGRAVVVAAGNDGDTRIHASKTLSNSINSVDIQVQVPEYEANPEDMNDYILFEVWYDGSASQAIKLTAPDGTVYGPAATGQEISSKSDNGTYHIDNASGGKDPFNQDHQAIIEIFDYEANKPPVSGVWKTTISGTKGRFDLWLSSSSMHAELISNTDQTMIVASPGTANNVITVGSYVTKNQWTDLDGNPIITSPQPIINNISDFSSQGPTRDGRTKPEICAPGEAIASSLSISSPADGAYSMFNSGNEELPNALIDKDGVHGFTQGTSFAAPHISGVIALIFEKYPELDALQIKNALTSTAREDNFTTTNLPNNIWGYGKADAFAAMEYASNLVPPTGFTFAIFQNPALTQFIDFYFISEFALESTPTATIQIGTSSPINISLNETESQIYKGEYQFTSNGAATFTIKATAQGQSETTITKFFTVQLLKPALGGVIAYDDINLSIPANSFIKDSYFTIFKDDNDEIKTELKSIGAAYKLGPADYLFKHLISISLKLSLDQTEDIDKSKIKIFRFEDNKWQPITSHINTKNNIVSAQINRLGTYKAFYAPDIALNDPLPAEYKLLQNYPNPFNASTTIGYELPNNGKISITIYNIKGELIKTLYTGIQEAGSHNILWNGKNDREIAVSSGLYIYKITANSFQISQKMLLLK